MPVTQRHTELESLEFTAGGQDSIELDKGLPSLRVLCRLSGTLNVSTGTTNSPNTFDDGLERLIPRVRLSAGGFRLIEDVDLRHLFEYHRRMTPHEGEVNRITDTEAGNAGDHDFELFFALHFARPHLVRPVDTALPKLPIGNKKISLTVEWSGDNPGNSSDDGTGAIIEDASDNDYTWTTEPTVDVVQVVSPTLFTQTEGLSRPFALPVYATERGPGRSASVSAHRVEFENDRRADYFQIRQESGADDRLEDTLTSVSMQAAGQDVLDNVPFEILRSKEITEFPGLDGAHRTGYYAQRLAEGGRLSNHLDPAEFSGLHLSVDQDAPSIGSEGQLDKMISQLVGFPEGVTQVSPRG